MKREVDYHEVNLKFIVTHREAKRVTDRSKSSDVRARLAEMLASVITDNGMNVLDAEEITVTIDGRPEIGA